MVNIEAIQAELRQEELDGWLFYDFRHRDPIGARVLGLNGGLGTRRWFYLVPRSGVPRKLVHRIEAGTLDELPGKKLVYASLQELRRNLQAVLAGCRKVAMQYSPRSAIPQVSLVDAGTVELVRAQGCRVVSSADLVQRFEACLSEEQYRSHCEAGKIVDRVVQEAFARAAARARGKSPLSEYALQQWILGRFERGGLVTDEPPIVAVNRHAGDPHYEPQPKGSSLIRPGDLLLLDIWGKINKPGSIYYDVTWVGFLGPRVPEKYARIFAIVAQARDRAIAFIQQSLDQGRSIQGWQVDEAAREVIRKAGFGPHFVHRTGHSIGQEVHGAGANMDGLETHDNRRILPHTCFSIEPGIYFPDFGVRSEVDVYIDGNYARVTGPMQAGILPLFY